MAQMFGIISWFWEIPTKGGHVMEGAVSVMWALDRNGDMVDAALCPQLSSATPHSLSLVASTPKLSQMVAQFAEQFPAPLFD